MLVIMGQLDKASQIFPYLYLGTEWNACDWQWLQRNRLLLFSVLSVFINMYSVEVENANHLLRNWSVPLIWLFYDCPWHICYKIFIFFLSKKSLFFIMNVKILKFSFIKRNFLVFIFSIEYIVNVTNEVENFFPARLKYLKIRVTDEANSELLRHWNQTNQFIKDAKYFLFNSTVA